MQKIAPVSALHNPNGYTDAEVLEVLQGKHGSRYFSFRYELLDSANVKIADLDNVLSGSVRMSWLAPIKRTADFSIKDDGTIDYLSNRIKPYVRLHMPPTIQAVPVSKNVTIRAWGAQGGGANGGLGGYTESILTIDSGTTLNVYVGGQGTSPTNQTGQVDPGTGYLGGYNGGGKGGYYYDNFNSAGILRRGGSGGGSSDVRIGGTALANRIVIAAGGGGESTGGAAGGSGGGTAGSSGGVGPNTGVAGGGGGTASAGGAGAAGSGTAGTSGALGTGGNGGIWVTNGQNGGGPGGGGGGYYGGGGGGVASGFGEAGGGGGGSGLGDTTISGQRSGDGLIEIEVNGVITSFSYTGGAQTFTVPGTVNELVEDGYVEWPQGVFVLSSPTRNANEAGQVTRQVEAYDLLQVFHDDVVDRYTVQGPQTTSEGFEDASLNFTVSGTWFRDSSRAHTGSWSFRSADIVDGQTSDAVVTVPAGATSMSFWWWTDSEAGWDKLQVIINGVTTTIGSGQSTGWTQKTMDVTGASTVTFRYIKDGSASVGADAVWIDDLSFTSPGALYTDAISTLLGSIPKNITPSTRRRMIDREWEPGTSKLQIINDLCAAIDYNSLFFDENGVAIVQPYVSPEDKAEEFTYADDSIRSVIVPNVDQTLDLFSIPNKWVLYVSNPDQAALVSTYTNNDPSNPTSTVRRGRTITSYEQLTDVADQATLDSRVARRAFEASRLYESVEFKTAMMPFHSGNDVYRITYGDLAINTKYQETMWEMQLKAGALMSHKARRMVTL